MTALKENYHSLAAAILHRAVDDYGDPKHRDDVATFLDGVNRNGGIPEFFYGICFFLGLDPAAVLERLSRREAV